MRRAHDKKVTTLYLREDLVHEAKQQGINISQIVNEILDTVLESPEFRKEEVTLAFLKRRVVEVKSLRQSKLDEADELNYEIQKMAARVQTQEDMVREIRRSDEIMLLMRQMRTIIEVNDFDTETAWTDCQGLVEQLCELDRNVDQVWFERYVSRLRIMT